MEKNEIKKKLFELSEEKYKEFNSKLCPGTSNIIGIRVPILKKFAKELSDENWRKTIKKIGDKYYEEIMLQGMIIGYAKNDIELIIKEIEIFVPKIDNWAVCDVFCAGLKITKKNKEEIWKVIKKYLKSDREFELRFAIVMMLDYYIDEKYIEEVLNNLNQIKSDYYYVKMAVAWAISIAYIKFDKITKKYLEKNDLDNFTYNKAIQKIIESYRISSDEKEILKKMKRR